ncbi:Cyclopropane-fatty-acyl-phospholipid synthase [Orpheovirus IHUMI-LCC2]|uniref:Cyclopropane-fatty-acyl-phospholipid synthase n=1 Tax=Orpheovirus IHUMI-LCC2 TaxID=2023057 RepID=A0A2I2L5L3_9VIRU|nr:Cyclopropane-fatty-acyl-phospholipid synthase [Orpheovirus IHUMI-LCC2]SNW62845.1 Cyclopropane-fatty-acyl-phospholipid synthase [Orpheovirus IHUMI-LCC2]
MTSNNKFLILELCKTIGLDIQTLINVKDDKFYDIIVSKGALGFGETYMDNMWESKIPLDILCEKIGKLKVKDMLYQSWYWKIRVGISLLRNWIWSPYTKLGSKKMAETHYDIGNELYKRMLGKYLVYSCAYFKDGNEDLEDAQVEKMKLCADKLYLKPGMKVLEIGFGWGELSYYLAHNCGVNIDAVTISTEQYTYALEHKSHPNINYMLKDYRDLCDGRKYDAIVSVGMFEHVGQHNYSSFFEKCSKMLKEDGLFLLHTIGQNKSQSVGNEWISKYIFPNSCLPSIGQITEGCEGKFIVEDVHNFGVHYAKTLRLWYGNFVREWDAINKERIENGKCALDEKFYRMWEFYLLSCAGYFDARECQLYQVVLSLGRDGGYKRPNV